MVNNQKRAKQRTIVVCLGLYLAVSSITSCTYIIYDGIRHDQLQIQQKNK